MIIGIGTDIVDIERIKQKIARFDFKNLVFSSSEIAYCDQKQDPAQSYAGKFAAKEAFLKAIGKGVLDVVLADIEVTNDNSGQPKILLTHTAKELMIGYQPLQIFVSISHTHTQAVACVVISKF